MNRAGVSEYLPRPITEVLARIKRQIVKVDWRTVARGDDDTLLRSSKVLAELREHKREIEWKLGGACTPG